MTDLAIRNCDLTIPIVLKRPFGGFTMFHVCVQEQEILGYINMTEQSERKEREIQGRTWQQMEPRKVHWKNSWRVQLKRKVIAQEITEWGGLGIISISGKGKREAQINIKWHSLRATESKDTYLEVHLGWVVKMHKETPWLLSAKMSFQSLERKRQECRGLSFHLPSSHWNEGSEDHGKLEDRQGLQQDQEFLGN